MPAGNSPGTSATRISVPRWRYEDTTDTTPIPWSTLQANFQPPNISTAAWNAMFPNLEAQVGNTWGGFVQRLDNDAVVPGAPRREGHRPRASSGASRFSRPTASARCRRCRTAVDASVPTPGPALTVDRAFLNSIKARNQMGPFGWGWEWTDGWQRVLSVRPTAR